MKAVVNWLGFAGGLCAIILVIASLFVPWWRLTVGENLIQANWSPLNTNFNFAGASFTIPLLLALNVSSIILLTAGGTTMLIYSIYPQKPFAKKLLGFAYRKPIYALLFFMIGLFAVTLLPKLVFGLDVPISGSVRTMLPSVITQGVPVSVLLSAGFQWTFVLAIAATSLCIAARFCHCKVASTQKPVVASQEATTTVPATPLVA